ncbi:MAG: fumarate hydratase, partial [Sphingobacteriia bacterium]|nr:fumarate hydratase [Sphingobacteriia bacterium]
VVSDPINRINTDNNTPAVIYTDIVPGDKVKITVAPKGAGSENMSAIKMCNLSATAEEIIQFVVDTVDKAGSNPCPPIIVGVGIGGTFDKVAYLAKKALLRPINITHPDPFYAQMEHNMLERINRLGIGPQGFGGNTTALAVNIEKFPTHIACLPVAVNIGCHVTRHKEMVL